MDPVGGSLDFFVPLLSVVMLNKYLSLSHFHFLILFGFLKLAY